MPSNNTGVRQLKTVPIVYFSDVLCIWAYFAQPRVDAVKAQFGDQVHFEVRFCSVFGDLARKIANAWGEKGLYEGFNAHLRHSAEAFPEATLNPDVWRSGRPASSASPHLFLKAAQLAEVQEGWAQGPQASGHDRPRSFRSRRRPERSHRPGRQHRYDDVQRETDFRDLRGPGGIRGRFDPRAHHGRPRRRPRAWSPRRA